MAFHQIQGARLFCSYQDSGGPRTLVCSNSLGTDHTMWDAQAASPLLAQFNLLRYDTRGHGRSEVTPGEYDVALLGRDVLGLLDAHQLSEAIFCGLSMGGLIGQWLLRNAPDRFSTIVLCNTAQKIGSQESWAQRIAQVRRDGLSGLAQATAQRWFTPSFREQHREQVQAILDRFAATSIEGYTANCAMVAGADFRSDPVTDQRVPVLVISGQHDAVTTPADGQELADSIAGARHVCLEAAHLSNVEAAEAFTAHLAAL